MQSFILETGVAIMNGHCVEAKKVDANSPRPNLLSQKFFISNTYSLVGGSPMPSLSKLSCSVLQRFLIESSVWDRCACFGRMS